MENSYEEIAITSEHTPGVQTIPIIHKAPFERIWVPESMAEGILLSTAVPVLHR
jgi:PIN domain nuclease of toxin-antitoxin system